MKERTRKKSYTIKEESGVAGISVKFNITEYTDGGFRIRGTLVEGKNDIPVDNVLPLVRYGNSHKELPTKKNHLTRALLDKLPVRSTGTRTTRVKPREALIKSGESGCRANFRRIKAQKCRNTLCISNFCNAEPAEICR